MARQRSDDGLGLRFTPAGDPRRIPPKAPAADPWAPPSGNDGGNDGGGDNGGNEYDDPYTSAFETLAKNQIAKWSQPFSDPGLDEVLGLVRGRIGAASSASAPRIVSNSLMGDFVNQGRQRISELNEEPFSAPEEDRLRTKALGNIEELRAAAKQRVTEDAARRGLGETSGLIQEGYQTTDRNFDRNRTSAESDIAQYITDERNRRRSEATSVAAQLAGAGAQDAQLQASQEATRAGFEQNRNAQIIQMAGMLADLAAQRRGEIKGRETDVLTIAQTLANLSPQRLAQATAALNGTGGNDANAVFRNTMDFSNSQAAQQQNHDAATSSMMSGLGQLLAYYAEHGGRA